CTGICSVNARFPFPRFSTTFLHTVHNLRPIFYSSTHRHAMCGQPSFFWHNYGLGYVAEQPNLIRVPFYHVFKTSPPLTRDTFYFYSVHLHPLMAKDEVEIDAALERIRQIWKCMMMRVRGLWEHVASGQGHVKQWQVVRG
ncbi:hypothetical protein JB92DRAFT_3061655, partial [Gautieria morchelliformis]